MKILHISYHSGCKNELEYVFNKLNYTVEYMQFSDESNNNAKYNMGHERAKKYWDKYQSYFETFDLIIVSDTSPISRVFLQNNYKGKLIIWICNRFDYYDNCTLDCDFPDKEYYELFYQATKNDNVCIVGYTEFENYYCKNIKNIDVGNEIIKPIGKNMLTVDIDKKNIEKVDMFFVPLYHNDTKMINLSNMLNDIGIANYCGRYNGIIDLLKYKGIVHIPYAWSNFALFEGMQNEIIYFIPSIEFLFELKKNKDFFWSPPYDDSLIKMSEWYCDDNAELFVYFNSWEDLKNKILTIDYDKKKEQIKKFAVKHEEIQMYKWIEMLYIKQYKHYITSSLRKYYDETEYLKYFDRIPKERYDTFLRCLHKIVKMMKTNLVIVELGTSRSFVDGAFEGCNSDDAKYWNDEKPEIWDWSAGLFTYIFGEYLNKNNGGMLHTVDLMNSHIERCKIITNKFKNNITYYNMSSEDFLTLFDQKIDLLYLDTGDMTPIEPTAQLHLREAEIIIKKNLMNENGVILIDDVKNITPKREGEVSDFGKAKYSIPYFLKNDYVMIADEYQIILQKNNNI